MEGTKAITAISTSQHDLAHAMESPISSLLVDMSQQVEDAMQNLHKMTCEIDQSCADIAEEMEKCKASAAAKSKVLEEAKVRFQKAAMAVLEMLNNTYS